MMFLLFLFLNTFLFSYQPSKISDELISSLLKNKISKICVFNINKNSDLYSIELKKTLQEKNLGICDEETVNTIGIDSETINNDTLEQLDSMFNVNGAVLIKESSELINLKLILVPSGKEVFNKNYKKAAELMIDNKEELKKKSEVDKNTKTSTKFKGQKIKNNSIGVLFGMSQYDYNFSQFKEMESNMPGAKSYSDKSGFNTEIFYRYQKRNSAFIASAGIARMGSEEYTNSAGKDVNITSEIEYFDLGCEGKFWGNLWFFVAGGAFISEHSLSDPVPVAGINLMHSDFKSKVSGPMAKAGLSFNIGNFLIKLGAKQMFLLGEKQFMSKVTGGVYPPGKYAVIIKNKNGIDFKKENENLSPGEEYLQPPQRLLQFFLMLGYKFSF